MPSSKGGTSGKCPQQPELARELAEEAGRADPVPVRVPGRVAPHHVFGEQDLAQARDGAALGCPRPALDDPGDGFGLQEAHEGEHGEQGGEREEQVVRLPSRGC